MAVSVLFSSEHKQNLFRVCTLRTLYLIALLLSLLSHNNLFDETLQLPGLLSTLSLLFLINLATYYFLLKTTQVSENMLFCQLLADIIGVYFLIYFYGGFSNPFISYLLVPVTIAAATLSRNKVITVFLSAILVYSLLMLPFYFHEPNPHNPHHGQTSEFSNHLVGMWLNFILSASLLSVFLERMNNSMKKKEVEINTQKEALALNEQIVSLGTFAADAAHELSTPLTTMAITINEMQHSFAEISPIQEDLSLLRSQIDRCKNILTTFTEKTGFARPDSLESISLGKFITQQLNELRSRYPLKSITFKYDPNTDIEIIYHAALLHSLKNILNNAAEASANHVFVTVRLFDDKLTFTCINDGQDITLLDQGKIGTPFYSQKEQGLGLGLFLAKITITQLGGELHWKSAPQGGTLMEANIPIKQLIRGFTLENK